MTRSHFLSATLALVGAGLVLTIRTTRRAVLMAVGLVPVLAAIPGALEASGGFNNTSFDKVKDSIGNLDRLQIMTARLPKALAMDRVSAHVHRLSRSVGW